MVNSTRGRWAGREPRLAERGLARGLSEGLSASSSAWMAAMAVSRSSSARSNCSGSAFSDLRPKAACLKTATSFSSRSIRSSLRSSRAWAAISIAFRAAISSGRSAASNMVEAYQIPPRLAVGICRPSHRAASTRCLPALLPQQHEPDASRAPQIVPRTGHVPGLSGRPGYLAK